MYSTVLDSYQNKFCSDILNYPEYYINVDDPMTNIEKILLDDGAEIILNKVNKSSFYTAWVSRCNQKGQKEWIYPLEWEVATIIFPVLEKNEMAYAMIDPFEVATSFLLGPPLREQSLQPAS